MSPYQFEIASSAWHYRLLCSFLYCWESANQVVRYNATSKVMATARTQVMMPLKPVLKQIARCLKCPDPVYKVVDSADNSMSVTIGKGVVVQRTHVYKGGPAVNAEESCEHAAQLAIHELMILYKVNVEDITYLKTAAFRKIVALFDLKKHEMRLIEGSVPKKESFEILNGIDHARGDYHVVLNLIPILQAIANKVDVCATPIETVMQSPNRYKSWVTVAPPDIRLGLKCLFSEYCATPRAAKQNLARKFVDYLMATYHFEVIDVNFRPNNTRLDTLNSVLEGETYLTLKERVLSSRAEIRTSGVLDGLSDQDCHTPKGEAFQIPTPLSPPPAPKRRSFRPRPIGVGTLPSMAAQAPVFFKVPTELEAAFKRPKRMFCLGDESG